MTYARYFATARAREPEEVPSLETLLTSRDYFGLDTASPVQRAICRVAEGVPLGDLGAREEVLRAIGAMHRPLSPLELYVISGSRCGKTLFSAALAYRASQAVDVSRLKPGDEPRIPILSLDRDKANACYLHLTESIRASPRMREKVIREGRTELGTPAIWLRHPSGRAVMVCVAAGKAAGNAVVSYFLAGCIFDEFCKMHGSDEAVVNFDDARRNALGRLLPGAQLVAIGSPWAPYGPAYEAVQAHHGKPTSKLVVVRARGKLMNPEWWTDERIASLPPEVARTEEAAEFLTPEESLFSEGELQRATRHDTGAEPEPGLEYVAAMDPATRGNAWTLVVATRKGGKVVIAIARQWRGTSEEPLSPSAVLGEMADVLRPYGVRVVESDQWGFDPMRELAADVGLTLIDSRWTARETAEAYGGLRTMFGEDRVSLPDDAQLRGDLLRVRRKPQQGGGYAIVLPVTRDGRHCDYAPPIALVAARYVAEPEPAPVKETADEEAKRMMRERMERLQAQAETPWFLRGRTY